MVGPSFTITPALLWLMIATLMIAGPYATAKTETVSNQKRGPFFLIGTIIRTAPEISLATISKTKPDSRENYFVNAKIDPGTTVVKIEREKVTLRFYPSGDEAVIRTPPYDPSKSVKAGFTKTAKGGKDYEFHLSRSEVDILLKNISQVIMDAATEPAVNARGEITGFKLTYIKPGGIFERLGLSEGDVIQEVNGRKLKGPSDAVDLFYQLQGSSLIKVQVGRAGQKTGLTYLIR